MIVARCAACGSDVIILDDVEELRPFGLPLALFKPDPDDVPDHA